MPFYFVTISEHFVQHILSIRFIFSIIIMTIKNIKMGNDSMKVIIGMKLNKIPVHFILSPWQPIVSILFVIEWALHTHFVVRMAKKNINHCLMAPLGFIYDMA